MAGAALFLLGNHENMLVINFFGLSGARRASHTTPLLLHSADQLHRIEVVLIKVTVLSCLVLDHVSDNILHSGQRAFVNRILDLRVDGVRIVLILENFAVHLELVQNP